MAKAAPIAPFVMTQTDLLLEFPVVTLDAPAHFDGGHQDLERDVRRQRGQKIAGRIEFTFGPFDQQPFFLAGSIALSGAHAYPCKARGQHRQRQGRSLHHRALAAQRGYETGAHPLQGRAAGGGGSGCRPAATLYLACAIPGLRRRRKIEGLGDDRSPAHSVAAGHPHHGGGGLSRGDHVGVVRLFGLARPANLPPEIAQKLTNAVRAAIKTPAFRQRLNEQGGILRAGGGAGDARHGSGGNRPIPAHSAGGWHQC